MSRSRRRLRGRLCYACDEPAIGFEHFPPKGFVPIARRHDAFSKLPACDHHNQDRSSDDEYVADLVAMVSYGPRWDPNHLTKVRRSLHRENGALFKRIDHSAETHGKDTAIEIEKARFERMFGDIARAAVYIESNGERKMMGDLLVSVQGNATRRLLPGRRSTHDPRIERMVRAFDRTDVFPVRGRDDRVFFYQVKLPPPALVYIAFHGQFEAFVLDHAAARRLT